MIVRLYSSTELVTALVNQYPNAGLPTVMNSRYVAVTRPWVEKQFTGYIWDFEAARGQRQYRKRGNQCEHYALRAMLEVVDLVRAMPDDQVPAEAESAAIAAVKYHRGAGTPAAGWHEVNLWFFEGVWFPWEPQQRKFIEFTLPEVLTVHQVIIA